MCSYGCQHMIPFYNIQIIYVIETITECVWRMLLAVNWGGPKTEDMKFEGILNISSN